MWPTKISRANAGSTAPLTKSLSIWCQTATSPICCALGASRPSSQRTCHRWTRKADTLVCSPCNLQERHVAMADVRKQSARDAGRRGHREQLAVEVPRAGIASDGITWLQHSLEALALLSVKRLAYEAVGDRWPSARSRGSCTRCSHVSLKSSQTVRRFLHGSI